MPNFEEYQSQMSTQMSGGGKGNDVQQSVQEMSMAAESMKMSVMSEGQKSQMVLQSLQDTNTQISTLVQSVSQLTNEMRQAQLGGGMTPPTDIGPSFGAPSAAAPPMGNDMASPGMMMGTSGSAPMPPMGGGAPVMQGTGTPLDSPSPSMQGTNINWQEAGMVARDVGKMGAGFAGDVGQQWWSGAKNRAGAIAGQFNRNEYGLTGSQPGHLNAPDVGVVRGAYQSIGAGWDPKAAGRYSRGSYMRAMQEEGAQSARDWTMGGMGLGIDMFGSFGAAGEWAGGAAGAALGGMVPIPGVNMVTSMAGGIAGSMAGRALTAPMDAVNPLSIGMSEAQRGMALASPANEMSGSFLRSRAGEHMGNFGITEQADIAQGLRKETLKDLTMDTSDVQELQREMQGSGQFLGVQNADQYVERFKKAFDNSKMIMKSFHKSAQEAVGMMDKMYSDIGLDHGAEMAQFSGNVYAGAHTSGLSTGQVMQSAVQGARQAGGAGMMAPMGARMGIQSTSLAGQAATHTMPTDMLATLGGEKGVASMLNRSQMQFAGGVGGMMTAGGGEFSTVEQGLSQFSDSVQSSDDMLDFITNKHRKIEGAEEDLGTGGMQAQEFLMYSDMAKQLGGGKNTLKMLIANQKFQGDHAKAEGYLQTMRALPETMKRQQHSRSRQRADMRVDAFDERYSLKGRFEHAKRDFQNDTLGGGGVADSMIEGAADIGRKYELGTKNLSDWWINVDRDYVNQDEATELQENAGDMASRLYEKTNARATPDFTKSSMVRTSMYGEGDTAETLKDVAKQISEQGDSGALTDTIAGGDSWRSNKQKDLTAAAGHAAANNIDVTGRSDLFDIAEDMSDKERKSGHKAFTQMMREVGASPEASQDFAKFAGLDTKGGIKGLDIMTVEEEAEKIQGLVGNIDLDEHHIGAAYQDEDVQALMEAGRKLYQEEAKGKESDDDKIKKLQRKVMAHYRNTQDKGSHVQKFAKQALENMGITGMKDGMVHADVQGGYDKKFETMEGGGYGGGMGDVGGSVTTQKKRNLANASEEDIKNLQEKFKEDRRDRQTVGAVAQGATAIFGGGHGIVSGDEGNKNINYNRLRDAAITMSDEEMEGLNKGMRSTMEKYREAINADDKQAIARLEKGEFGEKLIKAGATVGEKAAREDGKEPDITGMDSTRGIAEVNTKQNQLLEKMVDRLEMLDG